ncbi:hypothetical protein QWY84_17605 [Aquisalimonas lutea]|uniref:hypothetical protein n=1 Tax=Aquisalimonas lutea TaxID=1327750 RepID=UPI0025B3863F|nr:hypothetical protein [Aquisalimonas lutea]MDN3519426.1 hypothetical protein [Aquisalimonas lutea]
MAVHTTWVRYRRDSILFAAVWLALGLGTLLAGNLDGGTAARTTAWTMAAGPVPVVAFVLGAAGTIRTIAAHGSGSFGNRILLTFSLLGVLLPPAVFAITYAVLAAKETTAGLLVVSTTFAWPGVANLAAVLLTDRQRRQA